MCVMMDWTVPWTAISVSVSRAMQTNFKKPNVSIFSFLLIQGCCREKHGIDLSTPEASRREQMIFVNGDVALEWPRPLLPHVKLVLVTMNCSIKMYDDQGVN